MKFKKVPAHVVAAFNDYGEKVSYELPTLSSLMMESLEQHVPDAYEVMEILEGNDGRLEITDNLFLCGTGYTALGLIENAEEAGQPLSEYIAEQIDTDQNCPFKETEQAWHYYAAEGDNWDAEREIANEVFVAMFGQSAEDMLITIARAINEKLPVPDGKSIHHSDAEPSL